MRSLCVIFEALNERKLVVDDSVAADLGAGTICGELNILPPRTVSIEDSFENTKQLQYSYHYKALLMVEDERCIGLDFFAVMAIVEYLVITHTAFFLFSLNANYASTH